MIFKTKINIIFSLFILISCSPSKKLILERQSLGPNFINWENLQERILVLETSIDLEMIDYFSVSRYSVYTSKYAYDKGDIPINLFLKKELPQKDESHLLINEYSEILKEIKSLDSLALGDSLSNNLYSTDFEYTSLREEIVSISKKVSKIWQEFVDANKFKLDSGELALPGKGIMQIGSEYEKEYNRLRDDAVKVKNERNSLLPKHLKNKFIKHEKKAKKSADKKHIQRIVTYLIVI